MLYELSAGSLSPRTIPPPALPPSLHLTNLQENNGSSNHPQTEGSKFTMNLFRRAFHHIVFPRRFGTVGGLERVVKTTVEDKNVVCGSRPSNSLKCRATSRPASRPSTTSTVPQSTASHIHISTPQHSPTTLITSFPLLDISDIPLPDDLLAREDKEREEDDPALALWHTEQLHRARLAKLTRHLGEEIPAEMVPSPAFLSCGTSRSPVHLRRGGYHHKRKSLDPLAFVQETAVTVSSVGVLRRSKSLKEQGDTHPALSAIDTTPKPPGTGYIASGVRSAEAMPNMVAIPNPAPSPITTPDHSNPPVLNIPDGNVPRERTSMGTYPDSLLSRSSRLSVETSSETSPFFLRSTKIRSLGKRPATADASRRVEKLANFFGVGHEDVSAVAHGTAQRLQFSSTSVAGDLAISDHALAGSQLEVEVKVNKPTRFWNGRGMTENVHRDDVMDKLRMMRAS